MIGGHGLAIADHESLRLRLRCNVNVRVRISGRTRVLELASSIGPGHGRRLGINLWTDLCIYDVRLHLNLMLALALLINQSNLDLE